MRTKKLIALLLTMMMIVGSIPAFSLSAFAEGETYTEVATYAELKAALDNVSAAKVLLTADIDCSEMTGQITLLNGAVIDGGGHTLTGVRTSLFTTPGSSSSVIEDVYFEIKNLNVGTKKEPLSITLTTQYSGILYKGYSNRKNAGNKGIAFDITNVHIYAVLECKAINTAGFIGKAQIYEDSTITNCSMNGSISGSDVAGFISYSYGAASDANNVKKISFVNCVNNAKITGNNLASGFFASTSNALSFIGCINDGAANIVSTISDSTTIKDSVNVTARKAYDENGAEITDAATVVKKLNACARGYFYVEADGTIAYLSDVPQLVAAQDTYKDGDTAMDVRFVAVIKKEALEGFERVGFKITPNMEGANEVDLSCMKVFTSLLAQGSNSLVEYSAGDFGGHYMFAMSITDVPVDCSFNVTPYAIDVDETDVDLGIEWTFTYVDGELTATCNG